MVKPNWTTGIPRRRFDCLPKLRIRATAGWAVLAWAERIWQGKPTQKPILSLSSASSAGVKPLPSFSTMSPATTISRLSTITWVWPRKDCRAPARYSPIEVSSLSIVTAKPTQKSQMLGSGWLPKSREFGTPNTTKIPGTPRIKFLVNLVPFSEEKFLNPRRSYFNWI